MRQKNWQYFLSSWIWEKGKIKGVQRAWGTRGLNNRNTHWNATQINLNITWNSWTNYLSTEFLLILQMWNSLTYVPRVSIFFSSPSPVPLDSQNKNAKKKQAHLQTSMQREGMYKAQSVTQVLRCKVIRPEKVDFYDSLESQVSSSLQELTVCC